MHRSGLVAVPAIALLVVATIGSISNAAPGSGGPSPWISVSGPGNTAIPDNNSTGVAVSMVIGDQSLMTANQVCVDITHPYRGDLAVSVLHNGATQVLVANQGGSADDIKQCFTVTRWIGQEAGGYWMLRVVDNAAQDVGRLNGWTVMYRR